jgi:RNA polymerase sigma-70 factor (ECF subfamily)
VKDRAAAETSDQGPDFTGPGGAAIRSTRPDEKERGGAERALPWPAGDGKPRPGAVAPPLTRSVTTSGERARPLAPPRFEAVYEGHLAFVWRSLRLLGVPSDALDDAAQDVFGTVARQLPRFEGRSSLRTWVFGITQNVASNHRRKRARKLARLESIDDVACSQALDELASRVPTPHAHAEGREAADLVMSFCAELEETRRVVFVLGVLEGVPAPEIAELLGLALNTVYTRIHAMRQALRERLRAREVEK